MLAGTAAGNQLSPNGAYAGGTSRIALIGYVTAALLAVLLIGQAAAGSWPLGLASFLVLPACLSGAVLVAFATGQQGTLAAAAGLLAVVALAVRLVIGTSAGVAGGRPRAEAAAGGGGRAITPDSGIPDPGTPDPGTPDPGFASPAGVAVPVLVTAVTLVPFIAMGDVPGMELLHTAASVILGGLVTTALVCLVVLPVTARLFGPALAAGPGGPLAWIATGGGPGQAAGVTVPAARRPAETFAGHQDPVAAGAEPDLVLDPGGGTGGGPAHRAPDPRAGPPAGGPPSAGQRPNAGRFRAFRARRREER